mmetsp:Transcript_52628/g.104444  ORF Transcript_52628/g.104444 Transcript_52628/m.104444 type:complete len:297 (+) Transcript_52628:1-891(+)
MILQGPAAFDVSSWFEIVSKDVLDYVEVLKLSVPALLYLVQNNLLYFALSHLRATPYKVTYNLKILTGAFFSAALLGQRLGTRKWFALSLLMVGVSVVQLNQSENPDASPDSAGDSPEEEAPDSQEFLGFLAVFAAALTSGFCGVYQQRILQRGGGNLWVRNAQMGVTSVVFGVGSVLVKDIDAVLDKGFFQGYCPLVWGVILLQSFGGLNVAFILRYADNILKGFAAAFSTMASCVLEIVFYGFKPTGAFLAGAVLINAAAYMYNTPGTKRAAKKEEAGVLAVGKQGKGDGDSSV